MTSSNRKANCHSVQTGAKHHLPWLGRLWTWALTHTFASDSSFSICGKFTEGNQRGHENRDPGFPVSIAGAAASTRTQCFSNWELGSNLDSAWKSLSVTTAHLNSGILLQLLRVKGQKQGTYSLHTGFWNTCCCLSGPLLLKIEVLFSKAISQDHVIRHIFSLWKLWVQV